MDNDSLGRSFEAVEWYKEHNSHCNKRHVAAMLHFNGRKYVGANGNQYDPCTEKGHDFCTRDESYGRKYVTCPSSCAEIAAILTALFDGVDPIEWSTMEKRAYLEEKIESKALRGAELVTSDGPCWRCTSAIIDTGISKVYIGKFKGEMPRLEDAFRVARMGRAGVEVYQILEVEDEFGNAQYKPISIDPNPVFDSMVSLGAKDDAIWYFMDLLDPEQREFIKEMGSDMEWRKNLGLFNKHRFSVEHLY